MDWRKHTYTVAIMRNGKVTPWGVAESDKELVDFLRRLAPRGLALAEVVDGNGNNVTTLAAGLMAAQRALTERN